MSLMDTFWQGGRDQRLTFPKCNACGYVCWPPAGVCPECMSQSLTWVEDAGRGKIWSFVKYHRAYRKELAPYVPYVVALVELESGVRLISHIVDTPARDIAIGQAVKVAFRPIFGAHEPVPVFRPLSASRD